MNNKNVKNKGFFVLVITLVLSAFGLTVGPEVVEGVAGLACEVAHCGN